MSDILLQGHLYVTENYIAFHSNVFGYVTRVNIIFIIFIIKLDMSITRMSHKHAEEAKQVVRAHVNAIHFQVYL